MVRFYGFSGYKLDMTQSAPICLSLEQHQPLLRVGFASYLSLLALRPVASECGIIGRTAAYDLDKAGNRGCIGLDPFCLLCMECLVAIAPEVASFHPSSPFFGVSAFGPSPQHGPLGMADLLEDWLGCTVSVVVRPASSDRIQRPDDRYCRGLLMGVQIGTYGPHMFEDFCLLGDGQQCTPFPEFPDVKPQEVPPFRDRHNPGFGFTERQSSFVKKLLDAWSSVGFHYFPGGGRYHNVIGGAHNRYAFVVASAKGWGFGASVGVFRVEQPCHPIQCPIG